MAGVEKSKLGTAEFNPFAAGRRMYGSGRYNPTMGPVDSTGYAERERKRKVKLNALQAKVKAGVAKNYAGNQYGRFI